MLMKNALTALLGLTAAVEAVSVHHYRSPGSAVVRRQNKNNGGNRFGGGKNNNQNNNNQNNNNQNNNQGQDQANNNNQNNNQGGGDAASATCLAANAVQTGSQQTGQNGAVADGQVEAAVYVSPCGASPARPI